MGTAILKRYMLIGLLATASIACKSAKSLTAAGIPSAKLSARQLIKTHKKNFAEFTTLQARVKIDITQDEKTQGSSFNLRMEKDKVIWLSAALGLARLKMTPSKVQFYSKIDNEYFDGDYALISDFAGVELDFQKMQNLLLGQAIYNLESSPHEVEVTETAYVLKPKTSDALLDILYLIHPGHFKLEALELYQPANRRMLQVDYEAYQEVESQVLPKEIRIVAVDNSDEARIEVEFKSISLNNQLRFPFNIPEGFTEIQIK